MATMPYFVLSPNTILSAIGLIHGADKTEPNPVENWRSVRVDVVIPAFNEERNIPLVLASLARQTLQPERIVVIDDGSSDRTVEYVEAFAEANEMVVEVIRRRKSIGKTTTLKRQAREMSAEVEFILDGDTILTSERYIERTVEELYKGVGIASACGTILPLRLKDREAAIRLPLVQKFLKRMPDARIQPDMNFYHRVKKWITNQYRDALYMFLQRFVYRGQMAVFGSITNPVGCAVAYRREYIRDLFDHFEPLLGDDLTNSEDIFIGFALINQGYRNVQLQDVSARSLEPEAGQLPRQTYMWSSSFIQSCYYFDDLLKSPFKVRKRRRQKRASAEYQEKRRVKEPYRQPFGREFTREYGRPMGWVILLSAVEKVFFPATLLMIILLGWWEALWVTVAVETLVSVTILMLVARSVSTAQFEKRRWRGVSYFFRGILLTPVRYLSLMYDLVTVLIFLFQVWFQKEKRWRK